jgi:heme-degrading monooxygenase HmoA
MENVVSIDPFEVQAEAAEDFLKTWHAATGQVRHHVAFVEATLHRALNPNAPFPFVSRALWTDAEGFRDAITSTGRGEPPSGLNLYRIVAGAAGPGRAGADHVLFIVFYEVEPGQEEAPFIAWQQLAETLKNQAGNISSHFHRALDPAARFQWVNYALWTDVEAFQAARPIIEPVRTRIPAQAYPALYRIVAHITHSE